MLSAFDRLAKKAYRIITKIMGDNATWIPSDGSVPGGVNANVLFSNPTKSKKNNGIEYDPYNWQMEFYIDSFPGLKIAVDAGLTEVVTINRTDFHVLKVNAKWDGDISMAELQIKP